MRLLAAGIVAGAALAGIASRRLLDVVEVEGSSMAPTLLPGDWLLVEAMTYRFRPPRIGEMVLAPDPRLPSRELIKRVTAINRDTGTVSLAGDAREASTDSRAFGPVLVDSVCWRVIGRYWPLSQRLGPAASETSPMPVA